MNKPSAVRTIVRIPRDRVQSLVAILDSIGYASIRQELCADDLRAELQAAPELVEDWLGFSQDQRCTPSYYFQRTEDGEYIVGPYPPRPGEEDEIRFKDGAAACAQFILNRLDQISR